MTNEETLKLALEALNLAMENLRPHGDNCFLHDDGEYNRCFCGKDSLVNHLESVVEALEKALKQEQRNVSEHSGEPVAWMSEENECIFFDSDKPDPMDYDFWTPLYTTPPQSEARGLSQQRKPLRDEMLKQMRESCESNNMEMRGAFIDGWTSAEAAHGIKE